MESGVASPTPPAGGRLSILHVLEPAEAGGLESVVLALVRGQLRRGHTVSVAAITHQPQPPGMVEVLRDAGATVHVVATPARAYLRERQAVQRICDAVRPDAVHLHGVRVDLLFGGLGRRVRGRTISTAHGRTSDSWRMRLYERMQDLRFRSSDAVVAVSRPLGDALVRRGVPSRRVHVLPNAWGGATRPLLTRQVAREECQVPEGALHLIWLGRFTYEKGADVLVRALAHLGDLDVVVSLFGDGPDREAVERLASGLEVGSRIRWHGVVPGAARFLPGADIMVMSSRTEGTPIALFEAMAAGVPIVATRVGGVPDVVTDDGALLVPPENPAALAEAIRRAVADPEASARRVAVAKQRLISSFALEPWLDAYEMLYRGGRPPAWTPNGAGAPATGL